MGLYTVSDAYNRHQQTTLVNISAEGKHCRIVPCMLPSLPKAFGQCGLPVERGGLAS